MSRFKLSALLIITALGVTAAGSAALSSLSFDRSVTGQIMVDTDANVAVQFTNTSNYSGLVTADAAGKVSINLDQAINNNVSSGYNTDADFSVGSPEKGVLKIKNNSDLPIKVSLSDALDNNAIALLPVNASSSTIGVGSSGDYYFTINTDGQTALKSLNAVLHVEGE